MGSMSESSQRRSLRQDGSRTVVDNVPLLARPEFDSDGLVIDHKLSGRRTTPTCRTHSLDQSTTYGPSLARRPCSAFSALLEAAGEALEGFRYSDDIFILIRLERLGVKLVRSVVHIVGQLVCLSIDKEGAEDASFRPYLWIRVGGHQSGLRFLSSGPENSLDGRSIDGTGPLFLPR